MPATGAGADPPTLVVTRFPVPTGIPTSITAGPDGALWFVTTETRTVGRITTEGVITQYPLPRTTDYDSLGEITAGADGSLWVADCASIRRVWFTEAGYGIGRMTTNGGMTDFALPNNPPAVAGCPGASPPAPTAPSGFSLICEGTIGRLTVADPVSAGSFTQFPASDPLRSANGIVSAADGALWYQADEASLPTGVLSLGGHSFKVTATDRVGNTTVITHRYTVSLLALLG